ncbi:MAG: hypothetical protein Q7K43_02190, partial [Candidatus Woesearchaeota archaeon]|nr:hypothetical protein [Candidatus Woesearchaeota archaeon]
MTKKLLGYAAVDSGQLMVCDPCYINSEWNHKDDFKDIRKYKAKKGGKIFEYGKDFTNYDEILIKGKTVNNLIISKELVEIPNKPNHNFSYGGCCSQTL